METQEVRRKPDVYDVIAAKSRVMCLGPFGLWCHEVMNKTKLAKTPWDSPVALLRGSILYRIDSLVSQKNMLYFREKEERIFKRETSFFFQKRGKSSFRQEVYENWQWAIRWNKRGLENFNPGGQSKARATLKDSRGMRRSSTTRKQAWLTCGLDTSLKYRSKAYVTQNTRQESLYLNKPVGLC